MCFRNAPSRHRSHRTSTCSPMTAPIEQQLFCPDCGYNLHGIASDRCPECGFALDRDQLARSRIPWTHRRDIGRARAYLRTVWLVITTPRTIADEVARPVDFDDARR